jgi:hypothetical protein
MRSALCRASGGDAGGGSGFSPSRWATRTLATAMRCARIRRSRWCRQIGTCAAIGLRGVGRQEHVQRKHRHPALRHARRPLPTTICWRANVAGSPGAVEELVRIVLCPTRALPTRSWWRGARGTDVGCVFGLARTARPEAALAAELAAAKRQHLASGAPARYSSSSMRRTSALSTARCFTSVITSNLASWRMRCRD